MHDRVGREEAEQHVDLAPPQPARRRRARLEVLRHVEHVLEAHARARGSPSSACCARRRRAEEDERNAAARLHRRARGRIARGAATGAARGRARRGGRGARRARRRARGAARRARRGGRGAAGAARRGAARAARPRLKERVVRRAAEHVLSRRDRRRAGARDAEARCVALGKYGAIAGRSSPTHWPPPRRISASGTGSASARRLGSGTRCAVRMKPPATSRFLEAAEAHERLAHEAQPEHHDRQVLLLGPLGAARGERASARARPRPARYARGTARRRRVGHRARARLGRAELQRQRHAGSNGCRRAHSGATWRARMHQHAQSTAAARRRRVHEHAVAADALVRDRARRRAARGGRRRVGVRRVRVRGVVTGAEREAPFAFSCCRMKSRLVHRLRRARACDKLNCSMIRAFESWGVLARARARARATTRPRCAA